jgi:hypothetical protein
MWWPGGSEAATGTQSRSVLFEHEGRRFSGRLIACALPAEAAERARAKARKKASNEPRELKEETLFLAGWLLVFSSLPTGNGSDEQVLALYRARWQSELVIKRMKQVLKLAQLRGKTALTVFRDHPGSAGLLGLAAAGSPAGTRGTLAGGAAGGHHPSSFCRLELGSRRGISSFEGGSGE